MIIPYDQLPASGEPLANHAMPRDRVRGFAQEIRSLGSEYESAARWQREWGADHAAAEQIGVVAGGQIRRLLRRVAAIECDVYGVAGRGHLVDEHVAADAQR